jgi:hypothetical protein
MVFRHDLTTVPPRAHLPWCHDMPLIIEQRWYFSFFSRTDGLTIDTIIGIVEVFYGLTRPITGYSIVHCASGATPGTDEVWSPGPVGVARGLSDQEWSPVVRAELSRNPNDEAWFPASGAELSPGCNQLGTPSLAAGGLSPLLLWQLKRGKASVVPRSACQVARPL